MSEPTLDHRDSAVVDIVNVILYSSKVNGIEEGFLLLLFALFIHLSSLLVFDIGFFFKRKMFLLF